MLKIKYPFLIDKNKVINWNFLINQYALVSYPLSVLIILLHYDSPGGLPLRAIQGVTVRKFKQLWNSVYVKG